jgi:hypothetical protein
VSRLENHFFERAEVFTECDFAFGPTVDVVENGPGNAPLGEVAKIFDIHDAMKGWHSSEILARRVGRPRLFAICRSRRWQLVPTLADDGVWAFHGLNCLLLFSR